MKLRPSLVVAAICAAFLASPRPARASYETWDCVVSQVQLVVTSATGAPRVAVQCQASTGGGISWFAFRISDGPELAKMILGMLGTAKAAGRTVRVGYESTDVSGGAWGCQTNDCRILKKLEMY
jgi:hypothetical protein